MNRPNILVMIAHDLGRHIGPYGVAQAQSPHLMQLADEGIRLDSHFVTSPGCSQSRSSFVTGRYPHSNGQFGLGNWGWKLHDDELLLPEMLRRDGYHTTLFGIWHLHEWTLSAFDTLSDDVSTLDWSPEGFAEVASHRAADWLLHSAPQRQPFYLHVGFWEVHRPFCGNERQRAAAPLVDESSVEIPAHLPENRPSRCEFQELYQSIALVDTGVQRVLAALEQSGLADHTLVLFTADHGLPFHRAKGTLYDPGIGVALLARWPGRIAAGSSSSALTSNVDLMPTMLDAAGIAIPDRVQGVSQLGLLTGNAPPRIPSEAIFSEKTYHEHYDPIRCIRTDRFKYIRNFEPRPMMVLPSDIYNSPTRQSVTDDAVFWEPRPDEELYDVIADPTETCNLVEDAALEDVRAELARRLDDWMEATDDPLRHGPILRPSIELHQELIMQRSGPPLQADKTPDR